MVRGEKVVGDLREVFRQYTPGQVSAYAPDEERQVETHLQEHPEAEQKLELLRQGANLRRP